MPIATSLLGGLLGGVAWPEVLIALLKRLAVPVPIIGMLVVALKRLKRQREHKHAAET